MKILWRITLFALTLVLGIQMAAFEAWSIPEIPDIPVTEQLKRFEEEKAVAPEGIRVMYAGEEHARGDEIAYLRFIVYNGTSDRISYAAKGAEWPFPEVYINGKKSPDILRCGSGMTLYFIEPRASAEFRVGVYEFETAPRKSDLITVVFNVGDADSGLADEAISQPFVLPDSFRRSIDVWRKEWAEE